MEIIGDGSQVIGKIDAEMKAFYESAASRYSLEHLPTNFERKIAHTISDILVWTDLPGIHDLIDLRAILPLGLVIEDEDELLEYVFAFACDRSDETIPKKLEMIKAQETLLPALQGKPYISYLPEKLDAKFLNRKDIYWKDDLLAWGKTLLLMGLLAETQKIGKQNPTLIFIAVLELYAMTAISQRLGPIYCENDADESMKYRQAYIRSRSMLPNADICISSEAFWKMLAEIKKAYLRQYPRGEADTLPFGTEV